MTIVASGSVQGFFREIVEGAIKSQGIEASEGTTSYVVSLLADYARPQANAESLDRPLTFLLDEALHTPKTSERFERLRTLGDGVLYTTGFFGDHFEAKGVDQKYVVGIGVTAYNAAASLLGPQPLSTKATAAGGKPTAAPLDVFGELAAKFDRWVQILSEVADSTIGKAKGDDSRGLLRLYERWLKTGSSRLAEELTHHGLVPLRGAAKGVVQ